MHYSQFAVITGLLETKQDEIYRTALSACALIDKDKRFEMARSAILDGRDREMNKIEEIKAALLRCIQSHIVLTEPDNKALQQFWKLPETADQKQNKG